METPAMRFARWPLAQVSGILYIVVGFMIVASLLNPYFGTSTNLNQLLQQCAVLGIMACGTTLLLIAGLIDFAVGAELSLVTVIAGTLINDHYPTPVAVLVGVLVGVAAAGLQGLVVAVFNVVPFIVSLGATTAYLGLALYLCNGQPFSIGNNLLALGLGSEAGIPVVVLVLAAVGIVLYTVLRCTRFGRHVYAVGGSERAAFLAGLRVQPLKLLAYLVAGVTVGIGGVVLLARTGSGSPTIGTGYELQSLAAAVIGGTSFSGGKGTIIGSLIGVVLLISITDLLALANVSGSISEIVTGAIVVVAAVADQARSGKLKLVNTIT
jgi:ribose/xylose/arabinose/galactoside ABC-type transport system permease subunit